jgi:hypothetical protein
MKENTQNSLLILGGVGVLGYFLYKSDFFKGVGQISTGAGQAAQGIGEGVGTAFIDTGQAIGAISGSIAGATENILDLLSPLGALGTSINRNLENKSTIKQDTFEKSSDTLSDIYATSDINTATEKSLRKAERQNFYTDTQTAVITGIKTYNPKSVLSDFINSVTPKVLTPRYYSRIVTGAVTNTSVRSTKPGTSSSYTTNAAAKGISGGLGLSSSDAAKLTALNIPLMSTAAGVQVAYTPQTAQKSSKLRQLWQNIF